MNWLCILSSHGGKHKNPSNLIDGHGKHKLKRKTHLRF